MAIKKFFVLLFCSSVVSYKIIALQPQIDTQVSFFENQSECDYSVSIGISDEFIFLLAAKSEVDGIIDSYKFHVSGPIRLNFVSRSDEFPSAYFKFGGFASGECPDGYEGPFFISVWTGNPDIPDTEKLIYRYCQKKDIEAGFLGFRIKPDGSPEVFADENTTKMVSSYTLEIIKGKIEETEASKVGN